jgi:acetyl-CoA acetyltransferase
VNHDAIRDKVAIVGMGCCKFGENWDKSPEDMIVEAAFEAYEDAGIDNPQERIEAVFCGAVYPSKGTAEVADALKLFGKPVSMTQNYCATGTDAFRFGVFSIACGLYDTVLVVGFDKPKDRGVSGPSAVTAGVRGLPMTPAGWFSLCAAKYFETYGAGREDLGFCEKGSAKEHIASGTFALDGELPVNTDGGLKTFGHPTGATGVRMLYENYKQLQGKAGQRQVNNAKLALTHNLGGAPQTCGMTIIGTP